jgi:Zn-dependent peptidase ImmA (M78 family)
LEIKKRVDLLINNFNTNCPFKIAKKMGIQIVHEPLGDNLGYYSKHFRIKIIHINETAEENKKLFICAHELGHAIFHPDSNTPFLKKHTFFSTDHIEVEANTFAVELLFPDDSGDGITINEAIEEYGIPKQLALLKSLG